jgi:hypothetical protein
MSQVLLPGRYDSARRRQSRRSGRERGVWVYVPAAELLTAGFDPSGPPPAYRVWGRPRGSVLVRLYDEGDTRPKGAT